MKGAGRVEDTWNLIGRAMMKVVAAVGVALGVDGEEVIDTAGLTVLGADSVKVALDIDWTDEYEQYEALQMLLRQVAALEAWVQQHAKAKATKPPISDALELLRRIVGQDLEPDPDRGGLRIRDGVAKDRIVSISDPEMRHGRKSRSMRFDGYKRHVVMANGFVVGTAVHPANRHDHEVLGALVTAARRHGDVAALDFDRGYLPSDDVPLLRPAGVAIHSRAWRGANRGFFLKEDFHIDLAAGVVTCPAQQQMPITNDKVHLPAPICSRCELKPHCTDAPSRWVKLHPQEPMLMELRRAQATSAGRSELRKRVAVEHKLARIDAIQGSKARYRGARKNELDLNRAAAVANLMEYRRLRRAA